MFLFMEHAFFSWDEAKSAACAAERGFDFAYAAQLFEGEIVERIDGRRAYGEIRVQAIGRIEGLLYVVIYTMRGDVTHIISAVTSTENAPPRPMNRPTKTCGSAAGMATRVIRNHSDAPSVRATS